MTASLLVWLASLWLYASPAVAVLFLVAVPAATRQDFWLRFPTPPVWKSLHYLFSPIDAALVGRGADVGLGERREATSYGVPLFDFSELRPM